MVVGVAAVHALPPTMENRRKFVRRRMFKGGCLTFGEHAHSAGCLIRDLSDGGARVTLTDGRRIPSEVVLSFDDGRPARHCFVKWRRDGLLGMQFIDSQPIAPA